MNLSSDVCDDTGCIPEKSPCNPGGGSPSLYHAILCITGPLFTKRNRRTVTYCGPASEKPIMLLYVIPHRVEQPNHKLSTKVDINYVGTTLLLRTSLLKYISAIACSLNHPDSHFMFIPMEICPHDR